MLPLHSDQELDEIAARLSECGALALILIEAEPLGRIERRYGGQAYQVALDGLLALVRELAHESLPPDNVLVTVERGGDTILTFLFRPRSDRRFYTTELTELSERIATQLSRRGRHAVYPYHRERLKLGVGNVVVLYNPNVKPQRQILQAVEDSRQDARMEVQLRERAQGKQLLDVILSENIGVRYEPVIQLQTGEALGYEALTRGPEGTDIYTPDQLFSQAEDVGLLFELDCLCRRVAFERSGCMPPGKKLFLNCLPTSIGDPSLRDDGLRSTLEKYQVLPSNLVLEISEKESIENFAIFREMRDSYRELGVQIAIDDAGAGYSSLEAIMEIAPDFMKADLGLVRGIDTDPTRQEVVRALSSVAQRIDAQVIAEGVETKEELRTLRDLGITYGQGYYFGPAVTPEGEPGGDS